MKRILSLLFAVALLGCSTDESTDGSLPDTTPSDGDTTLNLSSFYTETMDSTGLTKCVVTDYGAVADDGTDQTSTFQSAIQAIADAGGGNLTIPAGEYHLAGVYMRSNVHILVDSGVTFKPFMIDPDDEDESVVMINFAYSNKEDKDYILENCSIRGVNGSYTVDYSYLKYPYSIRFILVRLAKNFLIADAEILDNYTKHCGLTFSPADTEGADKWIISRPTDGEVRNVSIDKANGGYGLCQLHGANRLYLEDISANGGVTLRLETGADVLYAGVFDIYALNVYNECGKAAVMSSPHTVTNGTFKIENVSSKSSSYAFFANSGFIDNANVDDETATTGIFASDSQVVNIFAEYGYAAQVEEKDVYVATPYDGLYELYSDSYQHSGGDVPDGFIGPALAVVFDAAEGGYTVNYSNISSEGFPVDPPMYVEEIADREADKWNIRNAVPCYIARSSN